MTLESRNISRRVLIHGFVALMQIVLAIPALLWWQNSVLFVIGLSLFANFYSAISALEAADDSKVMTELHELKELVKNSSAQPVDNEAVEGMS